MSSPSFWRDLPVHKTLFLEKIEQVRSVCDDMIRDYIKLEPTNDFSYRILLPRLNNNNNNNNNKLAKKIGLSLQLEFTSQLRKRKLKIKMKEIRYIHDTTHFGWIITTRD
jgi:hypothetical protein